MLTQAASRVNTVLGLSLNRDDWPGAPISVPTTFMRTPKISWYGLEEPHLALLHASGPTRLALLVLPPDTPEEVALTAMLMTTSPGNCLGTTATLSLAWERAYPVSK